MSKIFYDLTGPDQWMNYRWVQPPQIVFLVCTHDARGSLNITPVTMGTCVGVNVSVADGGPEYHFAFSVRRRDLPDLPATHAYRNLRDTGECVIAFPNPSLTREIRASAIPLPAGISELEVAGLTPLASRHVAPPGIAECPVNLEARVVESVEFGGYFCLFLVAIRGVSVDAELVERDESRATRLGLLNLDPIFEVAIDAGEGRPPRMLFATMEKDSLLREPDDLGPRSAWIGSFGSWLDDEVANGRLIEDERVQIMDLAARWEADPDPERNRDVRQRLTDSLASIVRGSG